MTTADGDTSPGIRIVREPNKKIMLSNSNNSNHDARRGSL